jgi:hypothetical protein
MPVGCFFERLTDADQMAGNLFSRGVSPSEIEAMGYKRLSYWNSWHMIMAEQEKKVADENRPGKKK